MECVGGGPAPALAPADADATGAAGRRRAVLARSGDEDGDDERRPAHVHSGSSWHENEMETDGHVRCLRRERPRDTRDRPCDDSTMEGIEPKAAANEGVLD